jgi:hypothetical protein
MKQDDDMEARRASALALQPTATPADSLGGDVVTKGLQSMFQMIAEEPIPEEFLRLFDEIDARSADLPSGPGADAAMPLPREDRPGKPR